MCHHTMHVAWVQVYNCISPQRLEWNTTIHCKWYSEWWLPHVQVEYCTMQLNWKPQSGIILLNRALQLCLCLSWPRRLLCGCCISWNGNAAASALEGRMHFGYRPAPVYLTKQKWLITICIYTTTWCLLELGLAHTTKLAMGHTGEKASFT